MCYINFCPQIKVNLSAKTTADASAEEGGEGGEGAMEGGGGALLATSEPANTQAVDELKRAFELVEASSPGLSDLILQKIVVHLQQRYNYEVFLVIY